MQYRVTNKKDSNAYTYLLYSWTGLHRKGAFWLAPWAVRIFLDGQLKRATHLPILYADRGDRRKSPGVSGAAIAIFADRRDRLAIFAGDQIRRDRRIKSPGVSPA